MRIDDALEWYFRGHSRVIGVRPADPRVARDELASLKEVQLTADDTRSYYDAIHRLKESLQSGSLLHQPSAAVWKPVVDYYGNARGLRATYFDALNFQAWRIYFQNHGMRGIIDSDEPFMRALSSIETNYGAIVVNAAQKVASHKQVDEDLSRDLDLLRDLLDCPPEVFTRQTLQSIIEALEPCVETERHYHWFFFPVVGINSTLWRLFLPRTINRTLQECDRLSHAEIAKSVEDVFQDARSSNDRDRKAEEHCAAALLDRIARPPYKDNKVLIKNLLHFFYPVAVGLRYDFRTEFLRDKLETLDRIADSIAWCNEKFIRRLQKAVAELWGQSDVDFGLIMHFCSDLAAESATLSTKELKDTLVGEYGDNGERMLKRFTQSETHTFYESVARELDLDFDSRPVGWEHWEATGHIISIADRAISIEEVEDSADMSPVRARNDTRLDNENTAAKEQRPINAMRFVVVPDTEIDAAEESSTTKAKLSRSDRYRRNENPLWNQVKAMKLDGDFFEVRDRIEKSETEWETVVVPVTEKISEFLMLADKENLPRSFRSELRALRNLCGGFATTMIARGLLYVVSNRRDGDRRRSTEAVARRLGFFWNVPHEEAQKSESAEHMKLRHTKAGRSEQKVPKKPGRPGFSTVKTQALENFGGFLTENCLFETEVMTNLVKAGRYSGKEQEYLDKL
jgi:hypothetical protein